MAGLSQNRRERTVKNSRLTLFQGWNANYGGDKKVRKNRIFSVQIHSLDLSTADKMISDVPFLAVFIPSEPEQFVRNLIVEIN